MPMVPQRRSGQGRHHAPCPTATRARISVLQSFTLLAGCERISEGRVPRGPGCHEALAGDCLVFETGTRGARPSELGCGFAALSPRAAAIAETSASGQKPDSRGPDHAERVRVELGFPRAGSQFADELDGREKRLNLERHRQLPPRRVAQ